MSSGFLTDDFLTKENLCTTFNTKSCWFLEQNTGNAAWFAKGTVKGEAGVCSARRLLGISSVF